MISAYCMNCKKFKKKEHETPFGTFEGTCVKHKIGVNHYSYICEKVEPIAIP